MITPVHSFKGSYIIGISFISALGGYLFGFDFAVIAAALPFLREIFDLSPWWEGFLTGTLALGCIAGTLLAGKLADNYGRRPGLLMAAGIFVFSSMGMSLSNSLNIFLLMRFSAGIGVGMASILSPLYIAEVSPAHVRGRNVAINQLTIVLGILITNLVNFSLADQGPEAWRWMFGLGVIPSILFFTGVLWLPESPRYLVKAGKYEKAKTVLCRIGDNSFVQETFRDIEQSLKGVIKLPLREVFSKATRPALIIGIGLAVFQQFCGINVVFNYTSTIFKSVGANLDRQLVETVLIGIVNLFFTVVAMWQVDKLGRRPLILIGSISLSIIYIVLATLLKIKVNPGWISLFVLMAIATYAASLAPVTWVLISEIFPNKIRGTASSMAIVSLWMAYFILVLTFPTLASKLGTYGPFYLYAGICILGFFFILSKVKETKGKTLEELEGVLAGH